MWARVLITKSRHDTIIGDFLVAEKYEIFQQSCLINILFKFFVNTGFTVFSM